MRFVWTAIITGLAVWIVTRLPFGVAVSDQSTEWWQTALVFLFIGAIVAVVNAIVRPVLTVLAAPLMILTLGLFYVVIAWACLWIAAWITQQLADVPELTISGFWPSVAAAIVMSLVISIVNAVIPGPKR